MTYVKLSVVVLAVAIVATAWTNKQAAGVPSALDPSAGERTLDRA